MDSVGETRARIQSVFTSILGSHKGQWSGRLGLKSRKHQLMLAAPRWQPLEEETQCMTRPAPTANNWERSLLIKGVLASKTSQRSAGSGQVPINQANFMLTALRGLISSLWSQSLGRIVPISKCCGMMLPMWKGGRIGGERSARDPPRRHDQEERVDGNTEVPVSETGRSIVDLARSLGWF